VLRQVGRRGLALGRPDVALRAYRAILDQRPDDPEALKRVGQILAWNNDPRGARGFLERFNRVQGGDFEVDFQLGEIYTFERDPGRARAQFDRALRLIPPPVSQAPGPNR
jgi:tetratricopeptide (TPR) repeat protein